ncbi:MAG TPA: cyclic nucleotide-binding domain-containing protein [Minicystis sp.]|nr:cyclic nucleotide-binding domain-containing protein [Minicystis sp.]
MPFDTTAFGLTDVGRRRKSNEDSFLIDPSLHLYVVADGMGGHEAGEVASARAVEAFRKHVGDNRATLDRLVDDASPENRLAAQILVDRAVQAASADVFGFAEKNPKLKGMGTTFVGLVVAGACAILGHVGDSRIYLVRKGGVHRLTEDHTFVASQLRMGQITPEEAAVSPYKSVLLRGVGTQPTVEVDTLVVELTEGDVFLLCSDGLHGYLPDEEILPLVGETKPRELPARLIALANARGGKDNITAVVVGCAGDALSEDTVDGGAKMDLLEQLPLFHHFTYKERAAMLGVAHDRTFEQGETIVAEGSTGEELFVVVRGRVVVEKGGVEIAALGAGGHFGEMGLVESQPRSATVRALEPTRVLGFAQADVMNLMRREQGIAVKLLWSLVQVLSQRLRTANAGLFEAKLELADHARPTFRRFGS